MKNLNKYLKLISVSTFYLLIFSMNSCSGDDNLEPDPDPDPDPIVVVPETFPGPNYADNYTPIASWNDRSKWNLANVHDPTVAKDGDYYYMYQTDASYGNAHDGHGHFHHRRSKDLVNWEYRGSTMANAPAWVKDSTNSKRAKMVPALPAITPNYGYWAPCVRKVGSKFRMYYSIVVFDPAGDDGTWGNRSFIGLAETDDLASNNWTDKGMVVCSEPDGLKPFSFTGSIVWDNAYYKYNAIDPSFIETPEGDQYLIYGSWHSGIVALKLNPETGKPDKLESIDDYGIKIESRGHSRWQASEGPEIIYNPDTGYYYLFLAYDELSVAYNTRVVRSTNITGPYFGIDGGNVTTGADAWPMVTHPYAFNNHTGWVGFSHCSVFQNPDTKEWFYASQARLPENVPGINVSNAVMMGHVRHIQWTEDGWPVVAPERYAAVPKTTLSDASFFGTWEQITMDYQFKVIQKSVNVTLTSDKKFSGGGVTGTWSYDSSNEILTINGTQFNVDDAWDWEASPRKTTITYSGYTNSGRPIWAKKLY